MTDLSLIDLVEGYNDEADYDEAPSLYKNSPYYSDESLITTFLEKPNVFTVLSLNIQSLQAKFEEFKIYLETFSLSNINFSVILPPRNMVK